MSATAATAGAVRRVPNAFALALVALGAVLGVLALTVLDWFHGTVGLVRGSQSTAGDLDDLFGRLVDTRRALGDRGAIRLGLSDYYFDWLAWVLLAAAVVVAVVATVPTAEGGQVRTLGAVIAAVSILATLWAVDVYRAESVVGTGAGGTRPDVDYLPVPRGPGYSAFLAHLGAGAWCALAAFVLIGVGAAWGPRRVSR